MQFVGYNERDVDVRRVGGVDRETGDVDRRVDRKDIRQDSLIVNMRGRYLGRCWRWGGTG